MTETPPSGEAPRKTGLFHDSFALDWDMATRRMRRRQRFAIAVVSTLVLIGVVAIVWALTAKPIYIPRCNCYQNVGPEFGVYLIIPVAVFALTAAAIMWREYRRPTRRRPS